MTLTDFIFSEKRSHRIKRHLAFWLVWWLAYYVLFDIPVYTLRWWGFDNALTRYVFAFIHHHGIFLWIIKSFFDDALPVVVSQVIFIYTLLYRFLPHFLYKKKKVFIVITVALIGLAVYIFVAGLF